MDMLDNWLKAVHADGVVLVRTRVGGTWGFSVPHREAVMFHFVAEGRAFVHVNGIPTIELRAGELAIFPRGCAHQVTHAEEGHTIPLAEFMALRNEVVDSSTQASTLVCGEFKLDHNLAVPATRALPSMVHLKAVDECNRSALTDTLQLLRAEAEAPNFGNQIVVRNLLSLLFVYFMREWARTSALETNDWFSAIRTPYMARALARMHEAPQHNWTLASLAKEVGLSRAAFARQFNALIGEPPLEYLTRWRMGIAAQLLKETDLRLGEIAVRVGYQSEFSFSRAFKRVRGMAPATYRHLASD